MDAIFFELGLLIIAASIIAYIIKRMKQPIIPAYILTGLLLGPVFGIVTDKALIASMSEIGIAFLLFIVGLEIDISKLKEVLAVSTIGTTVQVVTLGGIGFFVASVLGYVPIEAFYLGLIIAFSSTMVVIKILSDKKELSTLHGRIIIGMLLMQDILAIVALSILTSLDNFSFALLIVSLLKALFLFLFVFILTKFVFPKVFRFAAHYQELLFLMAISVCFLLSIFFHEVGHVMVAMLSFFVDVPLYLKEILLPGFSVAIGAFAAGLSISSLPYHLEIESKITPLKDFFSILFFVALGVELNPAHLMGMGIPLFVFLALIVLVKPLLLILTCSFFGYKRRTSFFTGAYLSQVSEFSLIMVMQGLILGHISQELFSLTVVLTVITIAVTSYSDKFEGVYKKSKKFLSLIDKIPNKKKEIENVPPPKNKIEVVLIGSDRIGYSVFKKLKQLKKNYLVVDYNPEVIANLTKEGVYSIYGDIGDHETLSRLDFTKTKFVICTVPNKRNNLRLIRKVKEENKKAIVFVTAYNVRDALKLYDEGADYVILPHFLGGDHVSLMLEDATNNANYMILKKIGQIKEKHIKELHHRSSLGHSHPSK